MQLVLIVLVSVVLLPVNADPDSTNDVPPAVVRVDPRRTSDVDSLDWVLERLATAGIDVPSATVAFFDDDAPCRGAGGLFRVEEDTPTVHVCGEDVAAVRWSLAHELAHAWDHRGGLDDQQRTAFLDLRGLSAWHDTHLVSSARGCEQAAEIVAWGIADGWTNLRTSLGRTSPMTTDDLAAAFRLFTGTDPLWLAAPSG